MSHGHPPRSFVPGLGPRIHEQPLRLREILFVDGRAKPGHERW